LEKKEEISFEIVFEPAPISSSAGFLLLTPPTPPLERLRQMKHLLLTTIAAVVLVVCGSGRNIHDAVSSYDVEAV
jgi:hypothetical protein